MNGNQTSPKSNLEPELLDFTQMGQVCRRLEGIHSMGKPLLSDPFTESVMLAGGNGWATASKTGQ